MNHFIKILTAVLGLLSFILLGSAVEIAQEIPGNYHVVEKQELKINSLLPVEADILPKQIEAGTVSGTGGGYTASLKLFGLIPIKDVQVSVVKGTEVIPCGSAFGVKFYTDGVVVVGMADVDTAKGARNPAYDAGIKVGDVITAINGKPVSGNADVMEAFKQSSGDRLKLTMKRGTVGYQTVLTPELSADDKTYKVGIWVRDSTAGIGTMTFYDPATGVFGGLGHGICDVDTSVIMPLLNSDVVKVDLNGIVRGTKGQPGELQGSFTETVWGRLYTNNETGVYGTLNSPVTGKKVPVAMKQQAHTGNATIYASLDRNGPQPYTVEIEKVRFNNVSPTKNIVIKITDKRLLQRTGGIVQGMSGSPILQDGKLIGAVTHVFVNDPTKGYGIFAENMLNSAKTLEIMQQKDVS